MDQVSNHSKFGKLLSPSQQPFSSPAPPSSNMFSLNNMVSPTILLIIIILASIFFISGLLHLLVRFLPRPLYRDPDDFDEATALHGPLQQLFHLHDAGVDQTFIDTLPIFSYKSIIGVKDPFDCAVCLCEFEGEDKLRLLPKCSHAFHMDCVDTWLLSHSTCPLCRSCLLSDFSSYNNNYRSPLLLVLESGSETSRELVNDREANLGSTRVLSHLGVEEFGSGRVEICRKSCEINVKEDENDQEKNKCGGDKIVTVKLGKFKNVDGRCIIESSDGNNSNVDARRCFSMGSFEYVMDEDTLLKVPVKTPMKKLSSKKPSLPLFPGKTLAMSECDCESRRYIDELEAFRGFNKNAGNSSNNITNADTGNGKSQRESFSISKIWLRGKKDKPDSSKEETSRRVSSFRFPLQNMVIADEMKAKKCWGDSRRRAASEIDIGRWGYGGSEMSFDEENQSCNSLESQANTQSFPRRTLLWLMGRQNKVVHSSFPTNV
ncbi:RING-H2 finger protein ATL13 [Heracleum sosnowskyi]|uniref:RING-type E3 ubiquitin transferase n=1 Tax=Heracleum sosnowskyi TaxID=360622 RepID=A0AAD8IM89_9APIA|nr:RING-H2 finger protein ATL13 [Heracleum sosnowskyi]